MPEIDLTAGLRELEGLEATVRYLWETEFDGFSLRDDDAVLCDGQVVTDGRIVVEYLRFREGGIEVVPFDQDEEPPVEGWLVPSGYVFLDGRWQDPKDVTLVQVIRDGLLIKRRPIDLLPYDELVTL
jgi:hypothetical protein